MDRLPSQQINFLVTIACEQVNGQIAILLEHNGKLSLHVRGLQ